MNARPVTPRSVIRAIEGITALCLGSSDCVIWIEQSDAAAFCDDEAIYLPLPTGKNDQEYELLLALALREIAKLWYTKAAVMSAADAGTLPFAAVVPGVCGSTCDLQSRRRHRERSPCLPPWPERTRFFGGPGAHHLGCWP